MRIKYDPEVDAAYISFKKSPTEVTSIRLSEDIAIDLGANDEIVGIEILDASQCLCGRTKTRLAGPWWSYRLLVDVLIYK